MGRGENDLSRLYSKHNIPSNPSSVDCDPSDPEASFGPFVHFNRLGIIIHFLVLVFISFIFELNIIEYSEYCS